MVKLVKLLAPTRPEDEMTRLMNESPLTQEKRHYNGLSSIGTKCIRRLQFNHYDCLSITNSCRMIRLFGVGHRMEPVLIAELKKFLGLWVHSEQLECIGFAGHWKGHIDGLGEFLPDSKFYTPDHEVFLMEFKTHKASSFADVKKNGVKKSKPMHYDQMTSYMGHLLKHIKRRRAMYVAYNKDTSEIYLEWVEFDEAHFNELKRKESEVVLADSLLPRIGNDSPMWFDCKLCDALGVCFGKEPVSKSCKNCEHVDIHDNGLWTCSKGKDLKGYIPCEEYQLMEILKID